MMNSIPTPVFFWLLALCAIPIYILWPKKSGTPWPKLIGCALGAILVSAVGLGNLQRFYRHDEFGGLWNVVPVWMLQAVLVYAFARSLGWLIGLIAGGAESARSAGLAAVETVASEAKEYLASNKKCPFCAETIKKEAVLCRYCKRDLVP